MLETMHLIFKLVKSFQVSRPANIELHLDPKAAEKQRVWSLNAAYTHHAD